MTDPDAPPVLSKTQMNVVFGTIVLGMLLSALDQTIVSTALPTIVGDLGGSGHMSWVVTSYMLAETIATVIAGKFGDLFGRKRMFQISVAIFIVGSFFCGLAGSMTMLIAMRAVQGIGGGGLMVTATALIGDVIPLRERGRYQGALGAVFGVTTVIGPLLGGVFTDHLSWRWAFYVNVPVAIVVIALAARTIPGRSSTTRPSIDYLGVLFVALGAGGLTLATSWGGTEYAWGSPTIIGLFAGSVAALIVFVLVERRADEPILPLRLFRSRVFCVCALLSFIVGFAMLGALTFLPSFLQYVSGASATMSGVRTLPMVLGLLLTSLIAGQTVSRTGLYKPFPIVGAVVMGVGLFLLSRMDEHTSVLVQSLSMFVLGLGIGLAMQVLTIVVQNTAAYRDLGSATSGVTFFRTLGSSFGASIMGTIYANRLGDLLPGALVKAAVRPSAVSDPARVHALAQPARATIVHTYAEALHTVFLYVVPVAGVGLLVALVLPQVRMRGTAREAVRSAGEGFQMPQSADIDTQFDALVGRVVRRHRSELRTMLSSSGVPVDLPTAWGLTAVHVNASVLGGQVAQRQLELAHRLPPGVLTSFFDGLVAAGLVERGDGDTLSATAAGREVVEQIAAAWTRWISSRLADWAPDQLPGTTAELDERVRAAVGRSARQLAMDQQNDVAALAMVGAPGH